MSSEEEQKLKSWLQSFMFSNCRRSILIIAMVFQRHNQRITFENVLALVFKFMMPLKQDLPLPWTKRCRTSPHGGVFLRLHPHRPIYVCCTNTKNFLRRLCPSGQNALVCKPFDGGRHQSVWFDPPNHRIIKVFNPRDQARIMIQIFSIHTGKTLGSFDLFKTCQQIQIKSPLNHVTHKNTCGHGNQIAIIVSGEIFVFEVDHHPGQPIRVFLKNIINIFLDYNGNWDNFYAGKLCFNADGTKLMCMDLRKVVVWETKNWEVCYQHYEFGNEQIGFAAFHPATSDIFMLIQYIPSIYPFGMQRVPTVGDPLLKPHEWVLRRNGKAVFRSVADDKIPTNMSVSNSTIALSFCNDTKKKNCIWLLDIRNATCKVVRKYACENDKSFVSMHIGTHEETMLCLHRYDDKFSGRHYNNSIVLRKLCTKKKRKR